MLWRCRARCLALTLIGGAFITTTLPAQAGNSLELGNTRQAALAGGESHEYQFHLRAGEYARVVVEQRGVDLAVACLGPAGQEMFALDSSVTGDAEAVELIADTSGEYRLRITAAELHAPNGRYEITLRDIRVSTDRERKRIAAARAFAAGMDSRKSETREGFLQAIGGVERALGDWRAAGDRVEEATSLYTIGLLYIEIADRQKALQYTTEAFEVARTTLNNKVMGRAFEAIGRVHNSFGDKRKAIEYCDQALPMLRAAADRAGEANALDNAGVAYSGMGDKGKALVYYDQAVQIFRELQDRRLLAELAGNIGVVSTGLSISPPTACSTTSTRSCRA